MSRIEELNLQELHDLKVIVDNASEVLAKKLTDYALMSKDAYFDYIPEELKPDYERRIKYTNLSERITNEMHKRIEEFME